MQERERGYWASSVSGLSTNGDQLIEPAKEDGRQHFSFSLFHHCSLSLSGSAGHWV